MTSKQTENWCREIGNLESRATALENLCGEILATLRVNLDRGTLPAELEPLATHWQHRFKTI